MLSGATNWISAFRAASRRDLFSIAFFLRTGRSERWLRRVFARLVDLTYDISGSDSGEPMKLKGQDWPEGAWFLFYGSGAFVHFVHPDGYEFTINEDGKSLQLYVHERREEWEPAEFYQGQVSAVRRVENPAWTEAYRSGTHLRSPVFVRTLKRFWSAVKSGVLVKVSE